MASTAKAVWRLMTNTSGQTKRGVSALPRGRVGFRQLCCSRPASTSPSRAIIRTNLPAHSASCLHESSAQSDPSMEWVESTYVGGAMAASTCTGGSWLDRLGSLSSLGALQPSGTTCCHRRRTRFGSQTWTTSLKSFAMLGAPGMFTDRHPSGRIRRDRARLHIPRLGESAHRVAAKDAVRVTGRLAHPSVQLAHQKGEGTLTRCRPSDRPGRGRGSGSV